MTPLDFSELHNRRNRNKIVLYETTDGISKDNREGGSCLSTGNPHRTELCSQLEFDYD
jgi:hypothetical protein